MFINGILNKVYLGNTVLEYLIYVGAIILGFLIIFIINKIITKKRKFILNSFCKLTGKSIESIRSIEIKLQIQKNITPVLYAILFYSLTSIILTLSEKVNRVLYIIFILAITFFAIRLISAIIKTSLTSYFQNRNNDFIDAEQKVKGFSGFINIIIWTIGIIFIISNTGFNITGIITGLGIGGIALALASQNIFMDLFNYFVIFFDQPFQIGDFIVLDDLRGTVEKVGIKTTRIRSLSGEEIIISNSDLTSKRIHNYKKMEKRRVLFTIGLVYQTSYEKLIMIPDLIKTMIKKVGDTEFDRAHFKTYGDSNLIFEVVYYVLSPDYNTYMDIQQKINLTIFKEFSSNGIEFAYPTSTVFIAGNKTSG